MGKGTCKISHLPDNLTLLFGSTLNSNPRVEARAVCSLEMVPAMGLLLLLLFYYIPKRRKQNAMLSLQGGQREGREIAVLLNKPLKNGITSKHVTCWNQIVAKEWREKPMCQTQTLITVINSVGKYTAA